MTDTSWVYKPLGMRVRVRVCYAPASTLADRKYASSSKDLT